MTGERWLDAQYSVLGSVLIEGSQAPKVIHETSERDYQGTCLTVFKAIKSLLLSGKPIDPVSVVGILGGDYQNFILQLMEITPTAANLDNYIALCKEQSRIIQIRDLFREGSDAYDMDAVRKIMSKANDLMVEKSSVRIISRKDAMLSFMERHTGPTNFLPWPVKELNEYIHAKPGSFIILGGYPSTGKTAWALQCADFWGRTRKVGFFSLETDEGTVTDRSVSSVTGICKDDILHNRISDSGWDKVCTMSLDYTEANVDIIEAAGLSAADVKAITMTKGYDIIFVDYLQLLSASGANRTEQVTAISIALHIMAQTMKVTIVALSQLNRDSQGSKPDMSRLKESSQLEQDADVIMIMKLEDEKKPNGTRILVGAKNKEGPRFDIPLAFDGTTQTFTKGQRASMVQNKFIADGQKLRAANKRMAQMEQMEILPGDYPVPF